MLGCSSSLFGLSSSDPLKDTFLLYKKVTEQYRNPEILRIIRSLIPQDIVLQTTTKDDGCSNDRSVSAAAAPIMSVKKIILGNSWKMRKLELFICYSCNYEYAFPRYGEILKIAETKTGRCSEWSMLFGAMLSSLGIKTRIVHDFLDHCWNEAMLSYPEGEQWVHVDSTLDYPISLNHPYHYEENWAKEYEYVLAFTADRVEDVTQTYTLKWESIQQQRLNKKKAIDFPKVYP